MDQLNFTNVQNNHISSQPSSSRKRYVRSQEPSVAQEFAQKLGHSLDEVNTILLKKQIEDLNTNQIKNLKKTHQQMISQLKNVHKQLIQSFKNVGNQMLTSFEKYLQQKIQNVIKNSNEMFKKQVNQKTTKNIKEKLKKQQKQQIKPLKKLQTQKIPQHTLNISPKLKSTTQNKKKQPIQKVSKSINSQSKSTKQNKKKKQNKNKLPQVQQDQQDQWDQQDNKDNQNQQDWQSSLNYYDQQNQKEQQGQQDEQDEQKQQDQDKQDQDKQDKQDKQDQQNQQGQEDYQNQSLNQIQLKAKYDKLKHFPYRNFMNITGSKKKSVSKCQQKLVKESMIKLPYFIYALGMNQGQKRKKRLFLNYFCPPDKQFDAEDFKIHITEILAQISSISFNLYFTDKLQFEKVKTYFCQNFLLLIFDYFRNIGLDVETFKAVNDHLSNSVLPFLKQSYPHSEQKQISRQLLTRIQKKNIFNENRFDVLENSKVKMTWHEKGRINRDIYANQRSIMRVLNYIIELPDTPISSGTDDEVVTLYEKFQEDMKNVFSKVYDKKFVQRMYKLKKIQKTSLYERLRNQKSNENKNQVFAFSQQKFPSEIFIKKSTSKIETEEEQQYRQKVQAYTKYKIGRKISTNSKKYDESQILRGNLTIKDTAIMRVLTKWIQSILQEFKQPEKATIEKQQPHRLFQGGQLEWQDAIMKKKLYDEYAEKRRVIMKQLDQLKNHLFKFISQDISHYYTNITQISSQCSEGQDIVGHVCALVNKANQSYVINFINKLIQHITEIEYIYQNQINEGKQVMLVNLKMGDLMRCQITSKEKQIIAVYEYLCLLCQTSPQVYELVRVKDRFNGPNKDILINIFYRQKIMIQIQLAIKNDSAFIECSDKYSHFIYQLTRNFLGPFSEICSVWNKFSPIADSFNKKIADKQYIAKKNSDMYFQDCFQHQLSLSNQIFKLPFWCRKCLKLQNEFYNSYQCRKCSSKFCRICSSILKNQRKFVEKKRFTRIYPFSTKLFKIYSFLSNKTRNMVIIQILAKSYIFTFNIIYKNQGVVVQDIKMELQFTDQTKQKQKKQFVRLNFIQKTEIKCQEEVISQILIKWWLKQKLNSISKLKKKRAQFLVTTNPVIEPQQFNTKLINALFEEENVKKISHLEKLSIFAGKIGKMPQTFKEMQKLTSFTAIKTKLKYIVVPTTKLIELNLMENQIGYLSNIVHLKELSKLEKLDLSLNKLQAIQLFNQCNLAFLKELNLANNNIKSLKGIEKMQKLERLILFKNPLQNLHPIGQLKALKELVISQCKLKSLKQLKQIANLQVLYVENNELTSLQGIRNNKKLIKIYTSNNKIPTFDQLENMSQLKFLYLDGCGLQILKNVPCLKNLQLLCLQNNSLGSFQVSSKEIPNIKYLNLKKNKLKSIQFLQPFQKLQEVDLQKNQIEFLTLSRQARSSLKILILKYNKLKSIVGLNSNYFNNLEILDVSRNNITKIEKCPNLIYLRTFLLNNNQIQYIQLGYLQNLVVFQAFNNKIKDVQCFRNTINIQKLLLQNNNISNFNDIQILKNLNELNIANNPSQQVPALDKLEQLYVNQKNVPLMAQELNNYPKLNLLNGQQVINKNQFNSLNSTNKNQNRRSQRSKKIFDSNRSTVTSGQLERKSLTKISNQYDKQYIVRDKKYQPPSVSTSV